MTAWSALALAALLVVPGAALQKLASQVDVRVVLGYAVVVCGVTFFLYFRDKKRAAACEWRISESALHLAELLGGWPAAFIAQRQLRHKIVKRSYQLVFWGIVLIHQYTAFDYLLEWHTSHRAVRRIAEAATKLR